MISSPSLVKATTEGVILIPSKFSITHGYPPSTIETHVLVVPKSIPITCLDLDCEKRNLEYPLKIRVNIINIILK